MQSPCVKHPSYSGDSRGGLVDERKYAKALGQQVSLLLIMQATSGVLDDWLKNVECLARDYLPPPNRIASKAWTRSQ